MDINKINPGGYGKNFDVSNDARTNGKSQTSFPSATANTESSAPTKTLNAVAQFSKSDLADPQKLDAMVHACASELINSGQNVTGPISVADKQTLENFLSSDPHLRQQIEAYLQKTLT